MAHGLHGQVFGGVALRADGRDVAVRGHRRRLLVGLLLAEAPRVVAVEQIAHALWGDDPDTGDRVNAVHAHVVRLRRLLDPDPERAREWLRSESGGYALRPDDVDLWEYERSIARARDLSDGEADQAMGLIEQALALWSRPWGELADHPSLVEYVRRAELRHRSVEERWAALALDTGRGAELADHVVALATADPTREQRWSMAMRALTIAGRQAEALALYDEARRMLAEELGIDPGPELRATHQAVLRQDAALQRHVRQRGPTHATGGDPFVGRLEELDSLDLLTLRSRVVTVAGLGGLGKSRLVREWANTRSRAQRTRWIDLRGVESDAVVIRMATELSLVLSEDTPAHALDMVRSSLRHTRTLLIIDNADSVAMSVAETIAALVTDIPHLSVVVTSRQPLGLTEERVLTLTPLPSSPEGSLLSGTAEELAYERLGPTATNARARAVAAATGGMPVAIEMVAARVRHDPEHVVAGPGAAGDVVARAADEAVLYLSEEATELFRHALCLPGGMSQRLATGLQSASSSDQQDDRVLQARSTRALRELVSSSLLVTSSSERGVRYRVLQPVVDARRAWTSTDDEASAIRATAAWLRSCVRDNYFEPVSPGPLRDAIDEWINLEEVMRWLGRHDPDAQLDLAVALTDVWDVTGRGATGHSWVRHALGRLPDLDPVRRARGMVAFHTSRGLAYIAAHGDVVREAVALLDRERAYDTDTWVVAHAQLCVVDGWQGDLSSMQRDIDVVRTAATRVGSPWIGALVDQLEGLSRMPMGEPAAGVDQCLRAAETLEQLGDLDNAANATYFACALGRFGQLGDTRLKEILDLGTERAARTGMPKVSALVAGEVSEVPHRPPSGARARRRARGSPGSHRGGRQPAPRLDLPARPRPRAAVGGPGA